MLRENKSIAYLKGIGPSKAKLLKDELDICSFENLLLHFPIRYEDRTRTQAIGDLTPRDKHIQISGKFVSFQKSGSLKKKDL